MSIFDLLLGICGGTGARMRAPVEPPTPIVNGRRAVRVPRNTQPLWQERGWTQQGDDLLGHFRTKRGSFEARIKGAFGRNPEFFIYDPPAALLRGSHGQCFQQRDKHIFFVHWSKRPADVNTGILRVEHCLIEALS